MNWYLRLMSNLSDAIRDYKKQLKEIDNGERTKIDVFPNRVKKKQKKNKLKK